MRWWFTDRCEYDKVTMKSNVSGRKMTGYYRGVKRLNDVPGELLDLKGYPGPTPLRTANSGKKYFTSIELLKPH